MTRSVQILALGVFAMVGAFGTDIFCPASPSGTALDTFTPPNVSNNPPDGCLANDMAITGFGVSGAGSNVSAPGLGDVSIYASGLAGDTTVQFDTPGSPSWSVNTLTTDQITSTLTFTVTGNSIDSIGIPFVDGDVSFTSGGAILQVALDFCPGQATWVSGCSGGGGIAYQYFLGAPFSVPAPATFAPTNQVGIQEIITIQDGYTINRLPNEFLEAIPEPATLPLLASALAGLGMLGYRRRKRNS